MTVYRRPIFDYDSLIREGCVNIYGGFDRNGADDGLLLSWQLHGS